MIASLSNTEADVMAMANAFRAASDDDNMKVMNAMTSENESALKSLKFYVVAKSWFVRAWPILTAKPNEPVDNYIGENLKQYVGKIQNSEIVLIDAKCEASAIEKDEESVPFSDQNVSMNDTSDGDNGRNSTLYHVNKSKQSITEYHRRISADSETIRIQPGLIHTRDYFFLGPSAWMLVKEKFGYDGYEICRCCKKISSGRIQIDLLPGEATTSSTVMNSVEGENINLLPSTIVPLSGRFPYEKVLSTNNNATGCFNVISQRNHLNKEIISHSDRTEENERSSNPIQLLPPSTTLLKKETGEAFDPLFGVSDSTKMEVESNENREFDDSAICTTQKAGRKRLASGLSNMGNTCFMNSTLQCLAHTESLRKYFLSGEYKKDLNRDNPLGTGGELATQFASLLGEMWGDCSNRRNVLGETQNSKYSNLQSNAVYPRNFKNSLGKHAEQFMGYDQHDSQELATYLLDALHEDTNRISKKPYVEKPEQGENESDEVAADKAWKMHLRREDSRILENFMGQVKSRLECCKDDCNRVSTTFDPFMYLSVPIPGEADRKMKVIFVPLDPDKRMQKLALTVSKAAKVADLLQNMNEELVKTQVYTQPIPLQDLCPVEIYDKKIFKWHDLEDDIDGIKEFDKTYVYQLKPLEEVQKSYEDDEEISNDASNWEMSRTSQRESDLSSRMELDIGDQWKENLERFSTNRLLLLRILNVKRSSIEEKIDFYTKLEDFIKDCRLEFERDESSRLKRSRDGTTNNDGESTIFSNVKTSYDVAVLEYCATKLRKFIADLISSEKENKSQGIIIQVEIRQSSGSFTKYTSRDGRLSTCLILRLASNSSVYSLRVELARRLSRSLRQVEGSEESSQQAEPRALPREASSYPADTDSFELKVLRRNCLGYDNKDRGSANLEPLGMLSEDQRSTVIQNGDDELPVAMESNEKERAAVATTVKNHGRVCLFLEEENDCKFFDGQEFDAVEVPENGNSILESEPDISVLDCIENYCKKEQLEDSEMWYCNKCKTHVRAWKQFHLYRTPPILIIHLKRFYFSASTHRRDKITRKIDFPLEGLDLTNLVSRYEENGKPIYDCYAVSNHFGGLGGGHYTAYTLSDDGMWCNYDDSRVTTNVDPKEVVSEAAYVLYYRRRDVPVGEDRDVIVDTQITPMICEQADARGEPSEISSNNTAVVGDMDLTLDDTVSNGSSKTAVSPMESVDNNDHNIPNSIGGFTEDRPLQ